MGIWFNSSNLSTVVVTELQAAPPPPTCPVLSLQQGQTCLCNYMYHEAVEARRKNKQHVWSIPVLCSHFWIIKEFKGFYCAHVHI